MISDLILEIEDKIKEEAEDVKVNQSNEEDPLKLTKDEIYEGKLEVKHLKYSGIIFSGVYIFHFHLV